MIYIDSKKNELLNHMNILIEYKKKKLNKSFKKRKIRR